MGMGAHQPTTPNKGQDPTKFKFGEGISKDVK